MDRAFYQSREFVVGVVVSCAFVAVGVASATVFNLPGVLGFDAECVGLGRPSDARVLAAEDGGVERKLTRYERVVTVTLPPVGADAGDLRVCTHVGHVEVAPSEDGTARIVFTIRSDSEEAAATTEVEATAGSDGGAFVLTARPTRVGEERRFLSEEGASVHVEVQLPDGIPWKLDARVGVGDVDVRGLLLSALDAATDVGDVKVADVDSAGDVDLRAGVGDVLAGFASVQTSAIRIDSDVGHAYLGLPRRGDVGYDVDARAGVGSVDIDLGEVVLVSRKDPDDYGADDRLHVRTVGFADSPTKVVVEVVTGVGDGEVKSS